MTRSIAKKTTLWLLMAAAWFTYVGLVSQANAQQQIEPPPPWYFHPRSMPPGEVGRYQLMRNAAARNYYQPVEIRAPQGVQVSFAMDGKFERPRMLPQAALRVGGVYRLRIRNIKGFPEFSVYPTVEIVNRLHPPAGQAWKFPIPIHFTQDDLETALGGKLVTRVVYIEDPRRAIPVDGDKTRQNSFDVDSSVDPFRTADRLGRPIAIIRLGSRVPQFDATGRLDVPTPPLLLPAGQMTGQAQAYNIIRTPAIRRNGVGVANRGQRIQR